MSTEVVTVITGVYPTQTPTVLGAAKAFPVTNWPDVDVLAYCSAASGAISLLGYNTTAAKWFPVSRVDVDATVDGGHATIRATPGSGGFSHLAVWERTAGATNLAVWLSRGVKR